MAETYIFFGIAGLQDRRVARDIVEGVSETAGEVFNTLPQLAKGEAWVWLQTACTLRREQFPMITTLDNSQTPAAPDRRAAPAFAKHEIDELRAILDDVAGNKAGATSRKRRAPSPTVFGAAIVDLRTSLRLTQKELGKLADMEQSTIGRIETGAVKPETATLERIATATGHDLVIAFRRSK